MRKVEYFSRCLFFLLSLQWPILMVNATARTNTFTVQPYAAEPAMGFTYSFYGEGIEYDSTNDRVLLGSINTGGTSVGGKIFAVPYYNGVNADGRVVYDESDMTIVFDGDSRILGIFGLQMDPVEPEKFVWAATGYFPPNDTTPCGAAKINMNTGNVHDYYDFTPYRSSYSDYRCMGDDIIFDDDNNAYVTDFYGYQIFKIDANTQDISVAYNDTEYLCNPSTSSCPPSADNDYPLNGPNGIEYIDDKLIVSVSTNRMVKINMDFNNYTIIDQVPEGSVQGCDGIIFDSAKERLYIAGSGTEGSVMVVSSDDDWDSLLMHTAYDASCVNDGTTAVAIAQDTDVMVYCSNNFGPAPYNVSVLASVIPDNQLFAKVSSTIDIDGLMPEGMTLDKRRSYTIIGSVATGNISGVPSSLYGTTYEYDDAITYFGGTSEIPATTGLELDPDNDCYLYAAAGGLNPSSNPPGLAYINICENELSNYVSLADSGEPGVSWANDVVVIGTTAYVTDSGGDTIWRVKNAHAATTSDVSTFVNVSDICSNPNGIDYTSDEKYLLVSCPEGILRVKISTRDYQYVVSSSNSSEVPEMSEYINGLLFDNTRSVLYGASNGIRIGQPFNRIVALYSSDNWKSCDVVFIFSAECPEGYPTALANTPDDNLYVLCPDAFGAGPYSVNYILYADEQISSDGSLTDDSSSSSSSSDDDEFEEFGGSSSKKDDDDRDDDNNGFENDKNIMLLIIGVFMFVTLVVYIVFHNVKGRGVPAAGANASD